MSTFRGGAVGRGRGPGRATSTAASCATTCSARQAEDALRRDFTVNALFYDPATQEILDYCDGFADLRKRVIRMIGDPEQRYREDPVRMLRAVRLAAKLGGQIEPHTRAPIRALARPAAERAAGARCSRRC